MLLDGELGETAEILELAAESVGRGPVEVEERRRAAKRRRLGEALDVFEHQAKSTTEKAAILQLPQLGDLLEDEERVLRRQGRQRLRRHGECLIGEMTRTASATVTQERLVEEERASLFDERALFHASQLAKTVARDDLREPKILVELEPAEGFRPSVLESLQTFRSKDGQGIGGRTGRDRRLFPIVLGGTGEATVGEAEIDGIFRHIRRVFRTRAKADLAGTRGNERSGEDEIRRGRPLDARERCGGDENGKEPAPVGHSDGGVGRKLEAASFLPDRIVKRKQEARPGLGALRGPLGVVGTQQPQPDQLRVGVTVDSRHHLDDLNPSATGFRERVVSKNSNEA